MLEFKRIIDLKGLLRKKSFFLLGPRATGKSFAIREQLQDEALVINLLQSDQYLRLSAAPWELESMIDARLRGSSIRWVVIDEVQKIPILLDEVHRLIEERRLTFLLTGSSARTLKRGHVNLLAGRAWTAHMFPLTYAEIPDFDLDRYLRYGGLPAVYQSQFPQEELNAYVKTYLYEEIQAEGLVRKLPQFSRFLVTAALSNGQLINFAQVASDTQIPASTIREHYIILEDTLIGFQLNPWIKSKKRKSIATAKFFFFDIGVAHTLAQTRTLERNSDLYGRAFEHWITMEVRAYLSYNRIDEELYFWRSTSQLEVDLVIGNKVAIEIKAAKKIDRRDLNGLKAIAEENIIEKFYLVSHDPIDRIIDNIYIVSWQTFISSLWQGQIL